ncbi:hypothetical protein SAMN02910400_01780 [Lachnospiraceae bacterium C10]|nr:hypothetical protein SAMN02910400_01780 [Lachnospiraceae bacterium C10]
MKRFFQRYIAKKDLIFILLILTFSLALLLGFRFLNRQTGGVVRITVDGKTFGTYPLNEDRVISIKNKDGIISNKLTIQNGSAHMSHANCPDGLCIHQGKINANGQSIVCLPNKIVCTVHSDSQQDMDVMTQ